MGSYITSFAGSAGGGIKASGTTVENEPIIKSDGVGEVMQWLASTGGKNITIDESATNGMSLTVGSLDIGHGAGGDTSNVAIGFAALDETVSGTANCVAIGKNALGELKHPSNRNTAVGNASMNALVGNSIGSLGLENTAVGDSSLASTVDGKQNTAVGKSALHTGDCADNNVAVGFEALTAFTGSDATAVGSGAASSLTVGAANTAIGYDTLKNSQVNDYNTVVGHLAGWATNSLSDSNTYVGDRAAYFKASGDHNVAIGRYALDGDRTGISVAVVEDSTNVIPASVPDATIAVGQTVTGSGISVGTYVSAIAGGAGTVTSFTLSQAATAGATITMYFHTSIGDYNIAIGNYALDATTTGANNVALGHNAGTAINTGYENVLIGKGAGQVMTDNASNVAIGYLALDAATGGENFNVAIGSAALSSENSNANFCVAIGKDALNAQDADVKNTAIGGLAGTAITTAGNNTFVGYMAGNAQSTGTGSPSLSDCTAVGHNAYLLGTGLRNTVIGSLAGKAAMTGGDNVCVGSSAGAGLLGGAGNVLLGAAAGAAMTTGNYNIAIGPNAADGMIGAANNNIAIGNNALGGATDACLGNIAIGANALFIQSGGASQKNLAIGQDAGVVITSGTQNVLVGHLAGSALVGDNCTALGYHALKLAAGSRNTAIGSEALDKVADGIENVAIGYGALGQAASEESFNTAVGHSALFGLDIIDGDHNTALGYNAGRYATASGTTLATDLKYCTYLGAGVRTSGATGVEREVVIGYGAVGNGSDTVTLGDSSTDGIHSNEAHFSALSDSRVKRDVSDSTVGLDFISKLNPVNYKRINPVDWPQEFREGRWSDVDYQQLVSHAVEAADEVWEDAIVQDAREATEEETRDEVHAAVAEVKELQVTQEAREEVKGERQKYDEKTVSEDVTTVEFVKNDDGDYVRTETTKTVERIERTALYTDHDVVNPDGTPCVDASGEPVTYQCPVMEEYVVEAAQEEVKEEVVVVEAVDEWTETHVTRPAEKAREEITERRLVSAAVEAKEAVYETVTVPADDRPDDDDTVRLGLIAQDVQTAMSDAGVEFDLVNESPNGKLSLKYGNLVMPLIKAVQELSARVKTLEG